MMFNKFPSDMQMDMMDCGPACLKMIAKYYGKYYSLQYLRDLCGNTREGVSLLGIGHAAEKIGLRSLSAKCTLEDILYKIPLPAIIHWNNNHFVVVYNAKAARHGKNKNTSSKEITEATIYVSDPAKGLVTYNSEEFTKHWVQVNEDNKGTILILQPQADFKQRHANEKSELRKTLQISSVILLLIKKVSLTSL